MLFRSDKFLHRIDALNHYLDSVYHGVLSRLVYDERDRAMIKTLTFSALPGDLVRWRERLEGALRTDLAQLHEDATFEGSANQQYMLGLTLAPVDSKD